LWISTLINLRLNVHISENSLQFCEVDCRNMHNENWDNLRYVLAVAESGSVLQAAKALRVNHATVLRQIATFEERHGVTIFERTTKGYRLIPEHHALIEAAQAAEAAMQEVARLASGGRDITVETVRLASTDTLGSFILPAFVSRFAQSHPRVDVAILSSNAHLDLLRAQAHIVVRPALKLSDDLLGEVVCELGIAAYAATEGLDKWHGLTGPLARSIAAQWVASEVPPSRMTTAADSFLTLQELAAQGAGIAPLPCFLGDRDARLVRLDRVMPHLRVPIWVARHVDKTITSDMRAVQTGLRQFLSDQRAVLLG